MDIVEKIKRYCDYQERCENDVREKLASLKASKTEADKIIREMTEDGYIDDRRYANAFARGKLRIMQWGKIKIKQELYRKKIDNTIITEALSNLEDSDYEDAIGKLIEKKSRQVRGDKNAKEKILRYVQSHGFEYADIYKIFCNFAN